MLPVGEGLAFETNNWNSGVHSLLAVYTTVYTDRVNQRKNGVRSHESINRQQKKKAQQSSDYQAFPSVGVTGFEPATTRPPDVYSKTEYSTYFQRIILLPNVAVDFSVDLTVKG